MNDYEFEILERGAGILNGYNNCYVNFFKKSLLINDSELGLDNIKIDNVRRVCKDNLNNLLIMYKAFEQALEERNSENGLAVYMQIREEIERIKG